MEAKCGIYKIENKQTKKVYIGQSIDIYRRWNRHKADSKKLNTKLYKDMKIFGIENFVFTIVEECNQSELDAKEIYWIDYYDSFYNGYNSTTGGQYGHTKGNVRPVRQYDLNGKFLQEYESLTEAERQTGISASTIGIACKKPASNAGLFQWRYASENIDFLPELSIVAYSSRAVQQYTLNGVFIREYDSLIAAAQLTQQSASNILSACQRKTKTAGGYLWKYKDDNRKIQKSKPIIEQYDLKLNKIAEYKSLTEANRATGVHLGNISECCKGQKGRTQAGGFIWKYKI